METIDVTWMWIDSGLGGADVEDLMMAWQDARGDTAGAYAAWCRAPSPRRRLAYAAYVAAADREVVAERLALMAAARE